MTDSSVIPRLGLLIVLLDHCSTARLRPVHVRGVEGVVGDDAGTQGAASSDEERDRPDLLTSVPRTPK